MSIPKKVIDTITNNTIKNETSAKKVIIALDS